MMDRTSFDVPGSLGLQLARGQEAGIPCGTQMGGGVLGPPLQTGEDGCVMFRLTRRQIFLSGQLTHFGRGKECGITPLLLVALWFRLQSPKS